MDDASLRPMTNAAFSTSSQAWEAAADELLHSEPSEKFLYYPPHSGFGNQVIEFRHALRVAGLLNRWGGGWVGWGSNQVLGWP